MNSRSESRKRTSLVGVRLTEEEFNTIQNKADALSLTPASYLRNVGLNKKISMPKIERDVAIQLAKQLQAVGTNLNQLARVANATGNIEAEKQLQAVREVLNDVWRSLN